MTFAQACGESTFHELRSEHTEETHGTTVCGLVATFGEWGTYDKRPRDGTGVTPCSVCFPGEACAN